MITKHWIGPGAVVLVLGLFGFAFCVSVRSAADPKPAKEDSRPAGTLPLFYYGSTKKSCGQSGCHSSPPSEGEFICACTEFPVWHDKDRHAKAFEALRSERSRRMGELLNLKDVTKSEECLSCHAVVINDPRQKGEEFSIDQGVGCVVCHGPHKEWVDFHQIFGNRKEWRALKLQEKEDRFGLRDLWTPSKRVALCASCHIGNTEPGSSRKFVTHQMYAAGHPPLPSFEAATFSAEMPPHWQHLRDKPKWFVDLLLDGDVGRERAKLVLVNAAASLRESMRLLARQAKDCPKDQALDLSNFDCYACHHDLKSSSWRQKRGYAGTPGRLGMAPWPQALVRLAIRHGAGSDSQAEEMTQTFNQKRQRLQAAFVDRPFGDCEQIAEAANDLASWAETLARMVDRKSCPAATVQNLLLQLPTLFKEETPDYHSARQMAWAFRILYTELHPADADPEIEKILGEMEKSLKLELPSGQTKDYPKELEIGLERLNSYEPEDFKRQLRKLRALLGRKRE